MLLERKEVLEMLRCPKTGDKLHQVDYKLVADSSEKQAEYTIIEDCPIVIDFDKSVLSPDDLMRPFAAVERKSHSGLLAFLRNLVSPTLDSTTKNVQQFVDLLLKTTTNPQVLVVGGGTVGQSMDALYAHPRISIVAFDIYSSPNVQFVADGHQIPLPDQRFDAVIIQAVLEHVLEPAVVVAEIHRVLKDQGIVYAETPFMQHVHEGAYDFTRYTESGHRYLFKDFELIGSGVSAGAGTQLLWSIDNFFRGLFRSKKLGQVIKLSFFWLQYFDKLIPESYNIDAASGVYFMGRKSNSPANVKEMIAYYQGAQ
jgi:ubiquinone/menaquinone biosynthesis C-methylase UbiE